MPKSATTVTLEEPVQFSGAVNVIRVSKLSVGAFSYLVGGRVSVDTTIGRFCSIAHRFEFGGVNHPTSWLSTSPVQYNREKFGWHETMKGFERRAVGPSERADVFGGPIEIGHDVWIGANVTIARGVKVGTGAILAAGAVVTKDVEPYTVVGGVPARAIRKRFDDDIVARLLASQWWRLAPSVLSGLDFSDVQSALDEIEDRRREGAPEWGPQPITLNYEA